MYTIVMGRRLSDVLFCRHIHLNLSEQNVNGFTICLKFPSCTFYIHNFYRKVSYLLIKWDVALQIEIFNEYSRNMFQH